MKWIALMVAVLAVYFAALFSLSAPSPAATKVLPFVSAATPGPPPTPTVPNVGVFWMLGPRLTVPTPFPAHVQGVFTSFGWTQIEYDHNFFDFSAITTLLNTLPAGKYAQIVINVGAYDSPMKQTNCTNTSYNPLPPSTGPHACNPWLATAGATGVTVYSAQGANGSSHGFPVCTQLIDPDPTNSVYIAEWENMVNNVMAFASNWNSTHSSGIGLVSITPMSDVGGNLSLSRVSSCTTTCPAPNVVSGGFCNYNASWTALTGINTSTNWVNYLHPAFASMWNYEIAQSSANNQNIALWVAPASMPDVSATTGIDNKPRNDMFLYGHNNQPSVGRAYVNNEALNTNLSWQNAVTNVGSSLDGYGAQMACSWIDKNGNPVTTGNCTGGCANLLSAGTTYANVGSTPAGSPPANWEEIYFNDVQTCSSEIQSISAALGGP